MFEKYRKIIVQEFYPTTKSGNPKIRFSVCRKAIAEFRALNPSAELLAELMFIFPETACKFTHDYGDLWESFYDSAASNYETALKYIKKNHLLDAFKLWGEDCLKYATHCGWGFENQISCLNDEYFI